MSSCYELKIYQCLKTIDRSFTQLWRMARHSAAEQPNLNRTPINPNTQAAEQWHMLTVHGTVVDVKSTFPVGTKGQAGLLSWA